MRNPAKRAFACWFIAFALSMLALVVLLGAPSSGKGATEAGGRALAQTGLAALLVWLVARRKSPAWSWLRFAEVYTATVLVLGLIASSGHVRAAGTLPFAVTFAPGWSAEVLPGLSSAAQDQAAGVRQRALWKGLDGMAVIEFSCAWLSANERADAGAQLQAISNGISDGYARLGLGVQASASRTLVKRGRTWRAVDLHAGDANGPRLVQTIAVTSSARCRLSATLTGTPQAFAAQTGEFGSILDRIDVD